MKKCGFEELPTFQTAGEGVSGEITLSPKSGRAVDHSGVKVELIGEIDMLFGQASQYEFLSLVKPLDNPGTLDRVRTYQFDFPAKQIDTQYESYDGINVRVRYFVRVTLTPKAALTNVVKEQPVWFLTKAPPAPAAGTELAHAPSKTEVGVTGFLHIEVTFAKERFHLKEVIVGKIFFAKVKLKIRSLEILLLKKERLGSGLITDEDARTETLQVGKVEVMDGFPAKGETVPIRIFLAQFADLLTPTMFNAVLS
ncbi:hypothetical protein BASA81_002806 [Batrachochytrium salamandrivorans]|nr:hypothetical protein BASA81_002806 [Batrachochytrium salamandrivorans]